MLVNYLPKQKSRVGSGVFETNFLTEANFESYRVRQPKFSFRSKMFFIFKLLPETDNVGCLLLE